MGHCSNGTSSITPHKLLDSCTIVGQISRSWTPLAPMGMTSPEGELRLPTTALWDPTHQGAGVVISRWNFPNMRTCFLVRIFAQGNCAVEWRKIKSCWPRKRSPTPLLNLSWPSNIIHQNRQPLESINARSMLPGFDIGIVSNVLRCDIFFAPNLKDLRQDGTEVRINR